jgi:hypothetical protein
LAKAVISLSKLFREVNISYSPPVISVIAFGVFLRIA